MVFLRESNSDLVPFYRNSYHDVSSNEASKYSIEIGIGSKYRNGISSTQAEALAKAVANACIRSTTRPKANRLRTTHPDEDVTEHLRYHVGPHTSPWWTGPEEPGAPSPSTLGNADGRR